jgi:hypothetical protein
MTFQLNTLFDRVVAFAIVGLSLVTAGATAVLGV